VGEDAFRQAAAHHVISHPPSGWTLDDVGEGFPETLRELFSNDPEVPELAWLEWAMHRCFVSADASPLDAAGFAESTAAFAENDWANMRLSFLPGTDQRQICHDIGTLWKALKEEPVEAPSYSLSTQVHCVVWREGLKPVFIQMDPVQGEALCLLRDGANYGEVCEMLSERLGEEAAIAQAGAMLGRWLHLGLLTGVSK
jgi:hypothetical protein